MQKYLKFLPLFLKCFIILAPIFSSFLHQLLFSFPFHIVFKDRGRGHHHGGGKKREEEMEKHEDQPTFIPVVGSFDEPELKPTTKDETTNPKKRKTAADHSQLPTDDYHFDRFRKRAKSHR